VLEENCTFNPIQIDPTDAQLLETQKWSAEQICRIFGVSPYMVGLPVPTGTYSNVEQSNLQYITMTLSNLAVKVEQELERVLFFDDERGEFRIVFDLDSMARGDMKSRMEAFSIGLLNGVYSINEVREREGLEGIDGGDEHRVPLNLSPASKPNVNTEEVDIAQPEPQREAALAD
jgi:HK97 family phage portal protein